MITGRQARDIGRKIVFENPSGIGPTAIGLKILALHQDMAAANGKPNGTIRGAVYDLDKHFPDIVKTGAGFAPKYGGAVATPDDEAVERRLIDTCLPPPSAPMPEPPPRRASKNIGRAKAPIALASDLAGDAVAATRSKIAALEDAVSQAHAEIENRDAQILDLKGALSKKDAELSTIETYNQRLEADNRAYQLSMMGELEPDLVTPVKVQEIITRLQREARADRIGVIAEAQNAAVLVDIRQAVLAGSEEGTLEAVIRVVDELGKVRTQLALTGIKDDGKRLKAARKLAGVDQKTLGAKLGYKGRHTIDDIERGKYPLAKHPKVLKWVQKIESKHAQNQEN